MQQHSPVLFIIPGACSLGAQISLEWLHIPYHIGITTPEIRQSEQFKQINPTGKVGALKDGEVVIGENLAILLYLADNFTPNTICPKPSSPLRKDVYQWLSYLASTLHPLFQQFNYPARFVTAEYIPTFQELALGRLATALIFIDNALAKRGFLVGDQATIVDAQAYALLRWCVKHNRGDNLVDLAPYPALRQFLTSMGQLKAVQNALAIEHGQVASLQDSSFCGYYQFN